MFFLFRFVSFFLLKQHEKEEELQYMMVFRVLCVNVFAFSLLPRKQHDKEEELQFGTRYVCEEQSWLSPMFGGAQAVYSFIVIGDPNETGGQAEFNLHLKGTSKHISTTKQRNEDEE